MLVAERTVILQRGWWSPDGRTILYLAVGPDDAALMRLPMHFPLYAVDVATRERRRVVDFPVASAGWSPDSRHVFLISGFEDPTPPPGPGREWFPQTALYVLDLQAGSRVRVAGPGVVAPGASWAPDGTRLAYSARVPGDAKADIFVVNRDGTGTRRLVDLPTSDINPNWSPDGASIYFVSPPQGPQDDSAGFHLIDVESRKVARVAAAGGWSDMQWTPDGTRVLAGEFGPGNTALLVTRDGQGRTTLGRTGVESAFSPDGLLLYYRTGPPDNEIWAIRLGDGTRR